MKFTTYGAVLALVFSGYSLLNAQQSASVVPMLSMNSQTQIVKQNTTSSFVVDRTDPNDSQIFDVTIQDTGLRVAVVEPSGLTVSPQNASVAGYDWQILTVTPPGVELLSLEPGTHHVITLPSGSIAGHYQISIDATGAMSDSVATISSESNSAIAFGVACSQSTYNVGDSVPIRAVLLEGSQPIAGATVNANVFGDLITTAITATNYNLVSSNGSSSTGYQKTFQVIASNSSGTPMQHISAEIDLRKLPTSTTVDKSQITFPDLPGNSSVGSSVTVKLNCAQESNCDPKGLTLAFYSQATVPIQLLLKDDGNLPDQAANDGVYTGSFTTMQSGRYRIIASAIGSGTSRLSVNRAAVATFATNVGAVINDVNYNIVTSPTDATQIIGINIVGNISVQEAASYQFCTDVTAGGSQPVTSCAEASIAVGSSTISTAISAPQLTELGGVGTYTIQNSKLTVDGPTTSKVVATFATPKPISGIDPSRLSKGSFYFNGIYSAQGVPGHDATYSALRVKDKATMFL